MFAAPLSSSVSSPRPTPRSADRLLSSCLAGEEHAWDRLFETSRPMIHAIARTDFGLSREDAEDVVQTVHMKLFEHLEELRDAASFAGWLRRVTRHTIIDMLRQKRPTLSLDSLAEEAGIEFADAARTDVTGQGDGVDAAVTLRLDVRGALASLPRLYREPVIYYLLLGKPQDEIGRLLGRPRSTVATQIQRGLQKLRHRLENAYGGGTA